MFNFKLISIAILLCFMVENNPEEDNHKKAGIHDTVVALDSQEYRAFIKKIEQNC